MAYSSLASVVIISPNKSSPRNHAIDTISIHCMAGQMTARSCGEWFLKKSTEASSNYGIGKDGDIGVYVDENDRSWATSSGSNDNRAITIEVASDSTHPYACTDAAYQSLILLLTDVCARNGIKKLLWQGDKSLIGQVDKQNMTVHRWFKQKACPGDYLYNLHGQIANQVNARLGAYLGPSSSEAQNYYLNNFQMTTQTASPSTYVSLASSNSALPSYVNRISARELKNRTGTINCITVHIARATGDIHKLAQLLNSTKKSYNYGIDNDGVIGLFADEALAANSTGNNYNDNRSINIICMNEQLEPSFRISSSCYNSLVNLCVDICQRNYILNLRYTGNTETDSLTMHRQFSATVNCPGPYMIAKYEQLADDVNAYLRDHPFDASGMNMTSSTTSNLMLQNMVNVRNIKPFVAKLSKTAKKVNFDALKAYGVVGVMLDAGERFNEQHKLVDYRTNEIYNQTLNVMEAQLPHGYIYTTRARTIDDVREEAYWFYFVVSKYPPKLGAWIHFQLNVTSKTAVTILDKWYEYLVKWGFKSKCGIYATKAQASLIGWPDPCNKMPLWLEGEMTSAVCPEEEVLTPSFFQLDSLKNTGGYSATTIVSQGNLGMPGTSSYQGYTDFSGNLNQTYNMSAPAVVNDGTSMLVTIPLTPYYTGTKKWMAYQSITSTSSKQYKIVNADNAYTDSDGFRKVDTCYLIAVGSGICSEIGTYIDLILENGNIIRCIMGDAKSDAHTDAETHIFTAVNTNYCCSEFIIDKTCLDSKVKKMGDCSYLQDSWNSPVVQIRVYSKNWFTGR